VVISKLDRTKIFKFLFFLFLLYLNPKNFFHILINNNKNNDLVKVIFKMNNQMMPPLKMK